MANQKSAADELMELNLEEARFLARKRDQDRRGKANRAQAIEISIQRDRRQQEFIQSSCKHLKGGKGTSQMYAGNDSNYAVITHTLSHGETIVVCQRCGKVERPPVAPPRRATQEERAKYRADLAEYHRWLNLPTDNEPSGTTLFAFTPNGEEAA
jgi:hypothetical protein